MKSYHFSFGDSSDGPVGYCARILAESEDEAVEILEEMVAARDTIELWAEGEEYLAVYLNPARVTAEDIDDVDEPEPFVEGEG